MPIKDQNNLTIVRAAAGKLIPENFVEIAAPIDLSPESIISITAPNDLAPESAGSVSAPNTIPSESVGAVSAPIDLSAETAGQMSAPNDLTAQKDLRVGGALLLCGVDVDGVGISEGAGNQADNVIDGFSKNTFERATIGTAVGGQPPIVVDFGQSFFIDTIAISAHNVGSTGGRVGMISTDGPNGFTTWKSEPTTAAERNETIIFRRDDPVEVDFISIAIEKSTGYEIFIGNIMIGLSVEMPPIYGGHLPPTLNRNTQYDNNRTGTGQWIGRSVKKRGYKTSFRFQHIDPLFARQFLAPLLDCIERQPFVVQWRPDKFPAEAIYCWTTDDPQLSNMGGGHDLMEMSFSVEAYRGL